MDELDLKLKSAHEKLCIAQVLLGDDEKNRELLQQALDRIEMVQLR